MAITLQKGQKVDLTKGNAGLSKKDFIFFFMSHTSLY